MTNCCNCSKELVPNAKFCKFCGATQAVQPQPVNEIPAVTKVNAAPACKKCGNELIPNAKFCKHCGTNVDAPHVATLPITETPKVSTVNTTASSNKIESEVVSNKVNSPSINSVEVTNRKAGISGVQIAIGLAAIILLAIFAYITKSNNSAAPAIVTPTPAAAVAPPPTAAPVVTPQAEVDPAQQAALKQAEDEAAQKKLADDEAKRIAEEEKAATVADAEEQKRLAHEEKMTLLQEQKDEKIKRADELKKAKDELALAKLKAGIQQAKRDEELARIEALSAPVAQQTPTTSTAPPLPQATQGKFQAKFRGFLGLKVATRYYATEDMKNEAIKLWKAEGKILEPDGSITIVKQENKAAEALGQ